jgi:hypothetical protein
MPLLQLETFPGQDFARVASDRIQVDLQVMEVHISK